MYFYGMKHLGYILVLVVCSCGQGKKYHDEPAKEVNAVPAKLQAILEYQEKTNEEFKDPETSPLPDRFRKDFEGLDFFPADTTYVVTARFERTPDAKPFKMPTTTDRKSWEVVYGIAYFSLNGTEHRLEVYKSLELPSAAGNEEYLFLPFMDLTNGEETYGGGRYLNLKIPEDNTLVIDFNRAYNPYCVYNKKYSCPLVPRQNFMNTKVMAGVKRFSLD